jgi:hypothetical protein
VTVGLDAFTLVIAGFFLGWTAFAAWIVFFDGAEWLEDTWIGAFIFALFYDLWFTSPATAVKVWVGVIWVAQLLCVLLFRSG